MKKINLKQILTWSIGIILIVLLLLWLFLPKAVEVEIATAKLAAFQQTIEEDGKTRAEDVFAIISPIQGELMRIKLKEGDSVKKGEVLAIIVPGRATLLDVRTRKILQAFLLSQQASVRRAEALVARAKAAMITAQSDYRRNSALAQKKFISESDLEQFQLKLDLRKKEYEAALEELNEIKQRVETVRSALLQFTKIQSPDKTKQEKIYIKSPENAKILKIFRKSAGSVRQGETILELADANKLEIVADLLSTQALKIPPNAKVIIKRWGQGYPLYGHVRLIEPNAFTKTSALGVEEQRVNVIIDFDSPKKRWQQLGAGYRVDVEIIIYSTKKALQVPISALFREKDRWAVFVIKNGKAYKTIIKLGRRNASMAVVLQGLKSGDKIINYPSDEISNGVSVKY